MKRETNSSVVYSFLSSSSVAGVCSWLPLVSVQFSSVKAGAII